MRVLGIVPARGGSKGVHRKNARLLHGKPLLAFTAEAALGSRSLSRVILSTDDEEIASIGRSCGLDVPFLRPAELASDASPMLPVILHAVQALERQGEAVDAICLLQPTSPLRTTEDIELAVKRFIDSGCDTLVSVLPVPAEHNPHWVYFGSPESGLRLSTGERQPVPRRQDLPQSWHREGSIYLTRRGVLDSGSLYGASLLGYPVDPERSVNIDTEADWDRAERMIAHRKT